VAVHAISPDAVAIVAELPEGVDHDHAAVVRSMQRGFRVRMSPSTSGIQNAEVSTVNLASLRVDDQHRDIGATRARERVEEIGGAKTYQRADKPAKDVRRPRPA
jgi:hypothetical protein